MFTASRGANNIPNFRTVHGPIQVTASSATATSARHFSFETPSPPVGSHPAQRPSPTALAAAAAAVLPSAASSSASNDNDDDQGDDDVEEDDEEQLVGKPEQTKNFCVLTRLAQQPP